MPHWKIGEPNVFERPHWNQCGFRKHFYNKIYVFFEKMKMYESLEKPKIIAQKIWAILKPYFLWFIKNVTETAAKLFYNEKWCSEKNRSETSFFLSDFKTVFFVNFWKRHWFVTTILVWSFLMQRKKSLRFCVKTERFII